MVVVQPSMYEDLMDETWQGTIKHLTSITKKQIADLRKTLNKKQDKMQVSLEKHIDKNLKKNRNDTATEVKQEINVRMSNVTTQINSLKDYISSNTASG